MPRAASRDPIYYRRRYPAEVIELCVRWYLTYRLSYRDLVAMMAERDVAVSHTTIMRWVQRYVPEFERRWARFSKATGSSWRMDETAVSVRGRRHYLYRAVDRDGKSVHSLLCEDRTVDSAQEFFGQAVKVAGSGWPEKVNLDGNAASHRGLRLLGEEDSRWYSVNVRARRYLNNIVEQDHRAIKRRCAPMLGLKSFATAAVTLSGVELAHRIRKRQFTIPYEREGGALSLKELWDQAISGKSISGGLEITQRPLTHQISIPAFHSRALGRRTRRAVARYARKVSFGRSLYLLVTPNGGRDWRYRYRFEGRERVLALGCYPEVPTKSARARHQAARRLLASGIDPADRRKILRQISAGLL
ncbi:MAG TPA: IS6 family transposase [Steroidobacteraceae bacterium]|nr:IS6 family transposase [Steroidobacteraceae bacterium]